MSRYNTFAIDGIYMTQDGESDGKPCKLSVSGIQKAVVTKKRKNIQASDGSVTSQVSPAQNAGLVIEVGLEWVDVDRYDEINAILNAKSDTGTIALIISGTTGDFSFSAIPGDNPVDFSGEFSGDIIRDVKYSFMTV
jgi:hypothetical protein